MRRYSKGAIALGMLDDADVGALDFVKGRVAFAYTFEPNYFTYGLSGDLDLHAGGVFGSRWGAVPQVQFWF